MTGCTESEARDKQVKLQAEQEARRVTYRGARVTESGGQPVVKVENGEVTPLSPDRSREVLDHSPTGYQWGYSGSGPSQTALALLLDATGDPDIAVGFHQDFKQDHVSGWGNTWEITNLEILLWLELQKRGKHDWV